MKHYAYISRAKVDMLYSQLPRSFFQKGGVEVEVKAVVISGKLKADRGETKQDSIHKLITVCKYIYAHENIGTINSTEKYIQGRLAMRFGVARSHISMFAGQLDDLIVCLVGSPRGILVDVPERSSPPLTNILTSPLIKYDYSMLDFRIGQADGTNVSNEQDKLEYISYPEAMRHALKYIPRQKRHYEFLAIPLHRQPGLLVATPLYVALAEPDKAMERTSSFARRLIKLLNIAGW
jgi:hypothetical protein